MNDELQKQLLTWAQNAANIASTEVPELARQYIHWQMASSITVGLLCFIFLAVSLKEGNAAVKTHNREEIFILSIFIAVGTFIGFVCSVSDLVKCIVAPKLVLLDLLR